MMVPPLPPTPVFQFLGIVMEVESLCIWIYASNVLLNGSPCYIITLYMEVIA